MKKVKKIIYIFILIYIVLNLPRLKTFASNVNFTFDDPNDYEYDTSKVEISNGYASLKTDFFNSNWQYRKAITIENPNSNSLTEYQIEVVINSSDPDFWSNVRDDGFDVRFLDTDNSTQLTFYFDEFSKTNQFARFWVKIPSMNANSTKTIYMYYGNPSANTDPRDLEGTFSYSTPKIVGYVVSQQGAYQNLEVISLADNNTITDGISTLNLDEQQTGVFNSTELNQNTALRATKLFYANFDGDITDAFSPISWASTEFTYYAYRRNDIFYVLSPFGTANVSIYDNGNPVWSGTVGLNGATINRNISDNHVVRITSDIPILVQHIADSYDSAVYYPATDEPLFGVPSTNLQIGAGPSGANIQYYKSDGSNSSLTIGSNGNYSLNVGGSQGVGEAYKVVSDQKIGVNGIADSDGAEMVVFLPLKELSTKYGANHIAQYIAVAAPFENTTCTVYNSSGVAISNPSGSNPQTGGNDHNVNKLYFGDGNINTHLWVNAGWKLECDKPVYAYFEKDTNSSGEPNDETQLFSYKQMRQFVYPTPYVQSIGQQETTYSTIETVMPKTGIDYLTLSGFSITLGPNNQGQIEFQISNDKTNWYYFDGSSWTAVSSDSDRNSPSTINDHISSFPNDVGTGTFYFKAFLISDGSQKVELDTVSINASSNNLPQVDAGSNKSTKDHTTIKPFSDASFSDSDGTIQHAYVSINNSSFTEIQQGNYNSLLEAVRNYEYTFDDVGDIPCTLKVEDDKGGTSEDSTTVSVEKYTITWYVYDSLSGSELDSLTVSDTSGWSEMDLDSPITHEYEYGTYTTMWSRGGYSSTQQENWTADGDKEIKVYLQRSNISDVQTLISYEYDKDKDSLSGRCWLIDNGQTVKTSEKCTINIYDDGNIVKTIEQTDQTDGVFEFDLTPTNLTKGKTYNLSAVILKSSQNYYSNLPYAFTIPDENTNSDTDTQENESQTTIKYVYLTKNSTASIEEETQDNEQTDKNNTLEISFSQSDSDFLKIISFNQTKEHLFITGSVQQDSILELSYKGKVIASTISIKNLWTLQIQDIFSIVKKNDTQLTITAKDKDGNITAKKTINITYKKDAKTFIVNYLPVINSVFILVSISAQQSFILYKKLNNNT